MGKFRMDDVRRIMGFKHNIRNMSVVAHVDHGKSTLTDSLVAAAGIIAQEVAGDVRVMDTRPDEIDRGITIKSTGISLYYKMPDEALKGYEGERQGNEYLVNLIDSPGHADFSSEVTAALRVTDGALVVVDCIEGVSVQTETILRQALGESVRPILSINKLDKCFLKHQLDGEEAYSKFQKVIENVNVILATYEDPGLGDVHVYPEKGTVAFSAGLHGWAFTLSTFAKMYAGKFGVDESKMTARLWGENFFDPGTRKWTKKNTGSPTCKRGFVLFCYEPLKQIIDVCINNQKDKLWEMLAKLDVTMRSEEKDLTGKELMKRVMQTWIPASNALLEMMIRHLPSPAMAQRYRVDNLYEGPHEDQYAQAMRACNPDGPLMLYVSKIIPASAPEKGRLFAFGRVFSGTVATGMKIRIMSPEHRHGGQGDVTKVHRTVIWMGKKFEAVREVPCGNTVAILLDDEIAKSSATVINSLGVDAHPFRAMLFFVSPAVRAAVTCSDSRKLAEELRLLNKTDPMLHYEVESSSSKFTVSCAGELQLDVCLRDLQDRIDGGAEIALSDPILPFRESVSGDSYNDIKKSANKSHPIWIEARPLDARLVEAIEIERDRFSKINDYLMMDYLVEEFGLDMDVAKKLVYIDTSGANMLLACKGVQQQSKIKTQIVKAFQSASIKGVLAEQQMRGILFDVCDIFLRDGCQSESTLISAFRDAQRRAKPCLMEKICEVFIELPGEGEVAEIHNLLDNKRASVIEETQRPGSPLYIIRAHLPLAESFNFVEDLKTATSGKAHLLQCKFDHHWEIMEAGVARRATADILKRNAMNQK